MYMFLWGLRLYGYAFSALLLGFWGLFYGTSAAAPILFTIGTRLLWATIALHFANWAFYRIKYRKEYRERKMCGL